MLVQVVFAGFSADSLAQRIVDCKPKVVITCNSVKRGAKPILLKDIVDAALVESEKNGVSVGMHWDLVLVHVLIILNCYQVALFWTSYFLSHGSLMFSCDIMPKTNLIRR